MLKSTSPLAVFVSLVVLSFTACDTGPARPESAPGLVSAALSAAPSLGTAGNFAILAGTAVTCTGSTVLGNVGVSPGTAITQTSCPVTGTINAADAVAAAAQADFAVAYAAFAAVPCDQTLTTLDGQSLAPGVYCFDAAVTSTGGVLTLNGPATGIWVFKVGVLGTGALTGTNFSVVTAAGTPAPCAGVYWWVAQAASLTDSKFSGTILAGAAATVTRGTFNGNVYAKAAVTLTGDAFTGCGSGGAGGGGGGVDAGTPGCGEDCSCGGSGEGDDGDHRDGHHHGHDDGRDDGSSGTCSCDEDHEHQARHDDERD